ncbi:hypothetical protein B0H19DRAFT_1082381 [Mycena capillaripes]|nr:hypothetical protein B0H19DRAFT_1082381 [Mycena capillaripes]
MTAQLEKQVHSLGASLPGFGNLVATVWAVTNQMQSNQSCNPEVSSMEPAEYLVWPQMLGVSLRSERPSHASWKEVLEKKKAVLEHLETWSEKRNKALETLPPEAVPRHLPAAGDKSRPVPPLVFYRDLASAWTSRRPGIGPAITPEVWMSEISWHQLGSGLCPSFHDAYLGLFLF